MNDETLAKRLYKSASQTELRWKHSERKASAKFFVLHANTKKNRVTDRSHSLITSAKMVGFMIPQSHPSGLQPSKSRVPFSPIVNIRYPNFCL